MNPIESILQDLLADIDSFAKFHKSPGAHVYTVTGYTPLDDESLFIPEWRPAWKKAQKAMAEFHNAMFVVDVTDDNPYNDLRFVVTVESLSQDLTNAGARATAEAGLEQLGEIYDRDTGSERQSLITDFFTDIMHLLGHAEATRLFDKAGDHWDEERAK